MNETRLCFVIGGTVINKLILSCLVTFVLHAKISEPGSLGRNPNYKLFQLFLYNVLPLEFLFCSAASW